MAFTFLCLKLEWNGLFATSNLIMLDYIHFLIIVKKNFKLSVFRYDVYS